MKILTCAEARAVDSRAVRDWKIPSLLLMENAGRSLAEIFCAHAARLDGGKRPRRVLICCGKGNNGGDGLVLFRRLELLGFEGRVVAVAPDSFSGDARVNWEIFRAATANRPEKHVPFDASPDAFERLRREASNADWIVDALLGTGAVGALRPPFDRIVATLNRCEKPIYAIDVPSGLNADDGTVASDAVRARLTGTLGAAKKGLTSSAATSFVGELYVGDIGVPLEPFLDRSKATKNEARK